MVKLSNAFQDNASPSLLAGVSEDLHRVRGDSGLKVPVLSTYLALKLVSQVSKVLLGGIPVMQKRLLIVESSLIFVHVVVVVLALGHSHEVLATSLLVHLAAASVLLVATVDIGLLREKVVLVVLGKLEGEIVVAGLLHEVLVNDGVEGLDVAELGDVVGGLGVTLEGVKDHGDVGGLVSWALKVCDVSGHINNLLGKASGLKERLDVIDDELELLLLVLAKVLASEGAVGVLDGHPEESKVSGKDFFHRSEVSQSRSLLVEIGVTDLLVEETRAELVIEEEKLISQLLKDRVDAGGSARLLGVDLGEEFP